MRVSILNVGTELLFGQIVNSNASFLSKELNDLGFDVMYHYVVGDNPSRIKKQLEVALSDTDIVITTGGLGPTQDDITKEIACEYFGMPLVLYDDIVRDIEQKFIKFNKSMDANNLRQAYFPEDAIILDNAFGTAPGCILKKDNKIIVCLPGPPRELIPMFSDVKSYLRDLTDDHIYYKFIKTIGIGESALETKIMDLVMNQTDTTVATYASLGETYLRITSKNKDYARAKQNVEEFIVKLYDKIGEYIYSTDQKDLPTVVFEKLLEYNLKISSAESCTGGLFASTMIDIEGSSQVFDRGIISYSNEAKNEILNVSQDVLDKFGAVSEETASAMAQGLFEISKSDISVSVTGIAGPDGGTIDKPVGLVYMAISDGKNVSVFKKLYSKMSRNDIRKRSVLDMYKMIFDFLEQNYEKR
ncbi:MAG: competence/damage-inducible protein A [Eubacteriales bacterium]|nr:competence/damage-inducible protein A [Eubacteriales bacterium]MDY3332927.1 competence/damage-inducible protein A [Gallibacter sp.]